MIIATIQGAEEGFEHTTVINGKLVKGKEENEAINKLYEMLPRLNINDDEGVIKANEHMALRWISVDEIEGLEWLPADWKVLPFVREKAMHLEDSELNSEHIQKR